MIQNHWKRNFFIIWAGQAVSLITSSVLQMAMIWYLTDITGSALVLSLATMAGFLPQAVLGTMIGVFVDRWNRKKVMIGADLLIAAAGVAMAAVSLAGDLPVWAVLLVLLIRSIGTAVHAPALNAVTPLLVPEDQLTKCAGYTQSVQSASYMLSPAIGAVLYTAWELNAVIALDAAGAVAACLTVAMVRIPKPEAMEDVKAGGGVLAEAREGYRALRESKGLLALLWVGVLYGFVFMPINALFPLMSIRYFGGTAVHASVVEIVFAAGMLVGGLLLGIGGGFKNRARSLVFSITLMGVALTVSGLLPRSGFAVFAVCSALMGLSSPFFNGVQTALVQEKIKPEYLGRVFGLMGSLISFAMPAGLILSGMFADRIGIHTWFGLSGICILGLALICVLHPSIRNIK